MGVFECQSNYTSCAAIGWAWPRSDRQGDVYKDRDLLRDSAVSLYGDDRPVKHIALDDATESPLREVRFDNIDGITNEDGFAYMDSSWNMRSFIGVIGVCSNFVHVPHVLTDCPIKSQVY